MMFAKRTGGSYSVLALSVLLVSSVLPMAAMAGPIRPGDLPPAGDPPRLEDPNLGGGGGTLDGGTGEWEPPVANTTDPNPNVEILTLNESQEGYIPHEQPEPYENLTKPDPNFIVECVNTGRASVQYGTMVIVNATVNNTGYMPVQYANVSFYDGPPSNATRFASVDAAFDGFTAKVSAPWVALGLGGHALYVVADPEHEVRELSEDDNSNSTTMNVVSYYVPIPPDVIPNTEESGPSGIPVLNVTTTLNITVSNIGGDQARNVTVEVVDTSVNETLDMYVIALLTTMGDHLRYVQWTPRVAGLVTIMVRVDTEDNATEGNETNNVGDLLINVMSYPPEPYPRPCPGYHQREYLVIYGNLIVYGICTFVQSQIVVFGNVQVYGRLNLWQYSTLTLRSPYPGATPYLDVYPPGGYLDSSYSRITALYSSLYVVSEPYFLGFVFLAHSGSSLYLDNSEVFGTTADPRTGRSGLQIETSQAGITYTTVAYGRQDGVSCFSATPTQFVGNSVFRNLKTGINLYAGCSLAIEDGSTQYNEVGIRARTAASVNGVVIQYNRYAGVWVEQASPLVDDSTIMRNAKYGVRVDGLSSPTIEDNVMIAENGEFGVAIMGVETAVTTPVVQSNPYITTNRVGVYVLGTQAQVRANNFVDNEVGLQGVGTELRAELNTFRPYPPGALPAEHRFGYVEVERPGTPELGIPPKPSTTDIMHNDFKGSSDRPCTGISIDGSASTRVEDNDLDDFIDNNHETWAMMVAESSSLNMSKNHFKYYARALIWSSSSGELWKNAFHQRERYPDFNELRATGGVGIYVEYSPQTEFDTLRILANWINFTGYSIYLKRSSPWIEWNQIVFDYYPPGHKFRDYDAGPGTWYQDLDRGAILVYDGSSPMIRQNYMEGNSYGISVEAGFEGGVLYPCNPTIEYNTIVLNGFQAIATGMRDSLYDLNSVIIRYNRISHSSGAGIATSSRAKVEIYGNTIEYTHGKTLGCNKLGSNECPEVYTDYYWAAIKIQVPSTPIPVPEQWLKVYDNTLSFGNQSGIWIAMGQHESSPDNSVEIYGNPVIRDFVWGIVDEGPRADGVGNKRHVIEGNMLWRNREGIHVEGNGMPWFYGNSIWGPRSEVSDAKGIAFYGERDESHRYTYITYNSVSDVDIGIFVYDITYKQSQATLTIKAFDHVRDSNYGILSETDEDDCDDAGDKGSAFDIVDVYFAGMDSYGLYTRCASPQVKVESSEFSYFLENKNGAFIYDSDHGRSGFYPRIDRGSFKVNEENGLFLKSTTIEALSSEFHGYGAGVVSTGTTVFSIFWDNWVSGSNNAGMWLGAGASGIIGVNPDSFDPRNLPNDIPWNGQGIYAYQTSVEIRENNFENNKLAIHLRGNDAPLVYKNTISHTAQNPCDPATLRDGIYVKDANHQNLNLRIEGNVIGEPCYGIHIVNSGMGNPQAQGRDNSNYGGWVSILSNRIQNGKGQGGLWVQGSKVVSNLGNDPLKGDEILEHQERKAVNLVGVVDFEAYRMRVMAYGSYGGVGRNPNALTASGTAYFLDSVFEALTANIPGGGGLIESYPGGEQTFERTEVNQLYTHQGVQVSGGSVVFKDSWVPKVGFQDPGFGFLVFNYGSAVIENTRVRGYTTAIILGYPSFPPGVSLTVKGNSDIQSAYYGIRLHSYTGTVLIENSNIHDCKLFAVSAGILHEDDSIDGTASIKGNTIQGNNVGIKILKGSPHIYGDEGAGNGNVITGNTQYGVYIAAGADADCSDTVCVKIEWNDIKLNAVGVGAEDPGTGDYFDGRCNWWNDVNGPNDPSAGPPDQRSNPPGQYVSDFFYYRDVQSPLLKGWLDKSMTDPTAQCTGGIPPP